MSLRWGVNLPGPFYLSGNVFPRLPRSRRRRGGRSGYGLFALFFIGIFWMLVGELILVYWCYLGMIGLLWWGIASAVNRRLVPWPVPSHAWTFWRSRAASAVPLASIAGRGSKSAQLPTQAIAPPSRTARPASVADELLKLQRLRQAGTISDAELNQLKRDLLAR